MTTSLKDIAATASQIISVVGPIIKFAMPGSDVAQKLAAALDVAGEYLRFGNKLTDVHLVNIQNDLAAIKAEVEEMAKTGESVPQEKWDAVHTDIDDAASRIRAAMGLS
jgi:hypothetical protein